MAEVQSAPMFAPLELAGLRLRNRVLKTATYEGMLVDGLPSRSLVRHHAQLAAGGVGMTTVAYCAVSPDARTFEDQMSMGERTQAPLRVLTDAVHKAGAAAMLQLGHCGGFSRNRALRGRRGPLGPSLGFNAYGLMVGKPFAYGMTEREMEQVIDDFRRSAVQAREAGFDAVELHLGHGYLLSQFISPHRNRRSDAWGGDLAQRMRFPLSVVDAVRRALPRFPLFAKINLDDGVAGGLSIDDAVSQARLLESHGLDALVLSGGLVSHSAMQLLRGARPLQQMIEVESNPLQKLAIAGFGRALIKEVPFTPLFWLPLARQVRRAVRLPLVLLGGITAMEHVEQALGEGFELVALGRALLHDPDLVSRWARGERVASGCQPCNLCITEMDRPGGVICAQRAEQVAERDEELQRGDPFRVADASRD